MSTAVKNIFLRIFLFFIAGNYASGQTGSNYLFRVYTQEEGLPSSSLKGIGKGNRGFLWFFSENGLSRFDGHGFKVFIPDLNNPNSIPSYSTESILVDGYHTVVFKTDNSICKYEPDSGHFISLYRSRMENQAITYLRSDSGIWVVESSFLIHINTKHERTCRFSFPSGFTVTKREAVAVLNGIVWLTNDSGHIRFNPSSRTFMPVPVREDGRERKFPEAAPYLFFSDASGAACFYSEEGLFRFDGKQQVFVRYARPQQTGSKRNPVKKAFLYKDHFLVISLAYDSVFTVDIRSGFLKAFSLNSKGRDKSRISVSDAIPSLDGSFWISTMNSGVYRIHPFTGAREHIFHDENNPNSLLSNTIEYLFEEKDVLFMTSPGIGIIKMENFRPAFTAHRPSELSDTLPGRLCNNIHALAEEDKNHLLVGTHSGLFRFDRVTKKFSFVNSPSDGKPILKDSAVSAIVKDAKGNFWISLLNKQEVIVVNFKKNLLGRLTLNRNIPAGDPAGITCMFIDSRKNLWIGTNRNAIYRAPVGNAEFADLDAVHPEKINGKVKPGEHLIFNTVFLFYENRDRQLLVGTKDGFYVYDYENGKFNRYTNSSADDKSVSNENVHAFYADQKGRLWIGTAGGGLNLTNRSFAGFKAYTTDKGRLSDNFIYSMLGDEKGYLWMGTNRGICRFDPVTEYYRNYTVKDGIQGNEFNTNAAIQTTDGKFIFGGINGLNIVDPASAEVPADTPDVVISVFKVNDLSYPVTPEVHLSYNENDVSFEFAALSFYRTRENQYAYKLEGLQDDWVYLRNRRYVNFTNLSPGSYTLRIKGCNYNGVWNEAGSTMHLFIAKPFWSTFGFRALVVLLFAGAVYLVLRYRFQSKLKIEHIREGIARDLHDEIGSNLSGISLFSSVAKEKLALDPSSIPSLLRKISEYTQASQDSINDIVWMIDTENDSFEKISVRMRKQCAEMLEPMQVNFFLNFDERLRKAKMEIGSRKNLYLIFKEALNNIVKYSDCKNVWIDLQRERSVVKLTIRDDGKGFDKSSVRFGNGLVNMKKRAEMLRGKINITSAIGMGTTLELEFSN